MFPQYSFEHTFELVFARIFGFFAVAFPWGFVYNYRHQVGNRGELFHEVSRSTSKGAKIPGTGTGFPPASWKGKTVMLTGEYQHNMDQKGRVTVPSKFREDLGDKFYVCKGLDGCLFVLSSAQWDKLVEKVSAIPLAQGKGIQRYFFSGAAEVEPDKQGRILIPQSLRDHAGLEKDVTVIGAAVRAEIWDTQRWNDYNASQTDEAIEASMNLLDF